MNERHRFRAWLKTAPQRMVDVDCIDYTGNKIWYDKTLSCSLDDVILLVCTGFPDKNNKLIYEGDVVKIFITLKYFEIAIIKWREYIPEFIAECIESEQLYNIGYHIDIEIIGNIYENDFTKGGESE